MKNIPEGISTKFLTGQKETIIIKIENWINPQVTKKTVL